MAIVFYGDQFAGFNERKERAAELFDKALSERKLVIGHDSGRPTSSERLDDAIDEVEKTLPSMDVMFAPDVRSNDWIVSAGCKHCGIRLDVCALNANAVWDMPDGVLAPMLEQKIREQRAACIADKCRRDIGVYFPVVTPIPDEPAPDLTTTTKLHITFAGGHCGDADCTRCDPMERYVDGLTVRECLERYTEWQRNDRGNTGTTISFRDGVRVVFPWSMTRDQALAARSAWSAALRAKVEAAREKERRAIVCDDDRWEVE